MRLRRKHAELRIARALRSFTVRYVPCRLSGFILPGLSWRPWRLGGLSPLLPPPGRPRPVEQPRGPGRPERPGHPRYRRLGAAPALRPTAGTSEAPPVLLAGGRVRAAARRPGGR